MKQTMNETKKMISYRRRCRQNGENTGLSHYILLTSETENTTKKDKE